jgi:quinol monooxygenase YgiN
MSQYALNTRFDARPDKGNQLLALLMKANSIVSAAKGCRLYLISHETADKDVFWVNELWDTREDHAISLTLDGCKELMVEAGHILATEPKQIVLTPVGGKGSEA